MLELIRMPDRQRSCCTKNHQTTKTKSAARNIMQTFSKLVEWIIRWINDRQDVKVLEIIQSNWAAFYMHHAIAHGTKTTTAGYQPAHLDRTAKSKAKKKPASLQAFLYLAPRPGLEPGTQ